MQKIIKQVIITIIFIFVFTININTKAEDISLTSFKIVSFDLIWEDGRLMVIGEIKNIGNVAAGVQLEAVARDKDNKLIDTVMFWPNSISNLPPGTSCGIKYKVTENPNAVQGSVRIVRAIVW